MLRAVDVHPVNVSVHYMLHSQHDDSLLIVHDVWTEYILVVHQSNQIMQIWRGEGKAGMIDVKSVLN